MTVFEQRIIRLWGAGKNTAEIAQVMKIPEHKVCRVLHRLRQAFGTLRDAI